MSGIIFGVLVNKKKQIYDKTSKLAYSKSEEAIMMIKTIKSLNA